MNIQKEYLTVILICFNLSTKMFTLELPNHFNFKNYGGIDFNKALEVFKWEIEDTDITVDFSKCYRANYQALALLVPYLFRLKSQNKNIWFKLTSGSDDASAMWKNLGANNLNYIFSHEDSNFNSNRYKPLFAIRNTRDFQNTFRKIADYTQNFNIGYEQTLRGMLSELFYNTLEHGK